MREQIRIKLPSELFLIKGTIVVEKEHKDIIIEIVDEGEINTFTVIRKAHQ